MSVSTTYRSCSRGRVIAVSTAFVLSGGGSLGAVQVGMLQALAEHSVKPDLLVGTSAGALNAAFISGCGATIPDVQALAQVWASLRLGTLFALDPVRVLAALAGRSDSLCSDRGLRALLGTHLSFVRLEDAPTPLIVVATEQVTGTEVSLRTGDASLAILASCAIPGIFPAVMREGQTLVDGGLADNSAVSQAVIAGAETVYVLPSGFSCGLPGPPRTPLGAVTHALAVLTHQRLVADVARYSAEVDLVVLPPPCPLGVSPVNFGRSHELIQGAYNSAMAALAHGGGRRRHPEATIAMHSHVPVK